MPALDKIEKLNYNFDERCKNLYIDTKSKFKNFIRRDSKEDLKKKDELNKKIDNLKVYLNIVQTETNKYIELYNNLKNDYSSISMILKSRENDKDSVEGKLKQLSAILSKKNMNKIVLPIKNYLNQKVPVFVSEILKKVSKNSITSTDINQTSDEVKKILMEKDVLNSKIIGYETQKRSLIEKKQKYIDIKNKLDEYKKQKRELINQREICFKLPQSNEKTQELRRIASELEKIEKEINLTKNSNKNIIGTDLSVIDKEISRIDENIKKEKSNVAQIINNKIKNLNENVFNENFSDILEFRKRSSLGEDFDKIWKDKLQNNRKNIKQTALEKYSIMTEKSFENTKKSLLKVINNVKSLVDKINNDKYYGDGLFKGFFTFFSTKQKQIDSLEKSINNFYKELLSVKKEYDNTRVQMNKLSEEIKNSSKRNQTVTKDVVMQKETRYDYYWGYYDVEHTEKRNVSAAQVWFNEQIQNINYSIMELNTRMMSYVQASEKLRKHINEASQKCFYITGESVDAKGLKLTGLIDFPPVWKPIETIKEFDIR